MMLHKLTHTVGKLIESYVEEKAAFLQVTQQYMLSETTTREIRASRVAAKLTPRVELRASVCTAGVFTGRSASGSPATTWEVDAPYMPKLPMTRDAVVSVGTVHRCYEADIIQNSLQASGLRISSVCFVVCTLALLPSPELSLSGRRSAEHNLADQPAQARWRNSSWSVSAVEMHSFVAGGCPHQQSYAGIHRHQFPRSAHCLACGGRAAAIAEDVSQNDVRIGGTAAAAVSCCA